MCIMPDWGTAWGEGGGERGEGLATQPLVALQNSLGLCVAVICAWYSLGGGGGVGDGKGQGLAAQPLLFGRAKF